MVDVSYRSNATTTTVYSVRCTINSFYCYYQIMLRHISSQFLSLLTISLSHLACMFVTQLVVVGCRELYVWWTVCSLLIYKTVSVISTTNGSIHNNWDTHSSHSTQHARPEHRTGTYLHSTFTLRNCNYKVHESSLSSATYLNSICPLNFDCVCTYNAQYTKRSTMKKNKRINKM